MARIRSIKPEFPQSETIGALSRDARLLFIQLWTLVDDEGRARAASRMLASLLYPYDDDAPKLMDKWLSELEVEKCIRRYEADGNSYLEIVNWLKHQKIDRPTPSRLPPYREPSTHPRDSSRALAADLGPRTMERDQGSRTVDSGAVAPRARGSRLPDDWVPSESDLEEARALLPPDRIPLEEAKFRDYWRARAGPGAVKNDWAATWRNWCRKASEDSGRGGSLKTNHKPGRGSGFLDLALEIGENEHSDYPQRVIGSGR